jgi:N-ethylmaleimide reductase
MTQLFSPLQLGPYTLNHRVVHAPTTRLRANRDDSPSDMMLEYYRQRASTGGLIVTESTHVSYDSRGYLGAPGIYEDRQGTCACVTGALRHSSQGASLIG